MCQPIERPPCTTQLTGLSERLGRTGEFIFLIGFCAGGTLNPGNWALYESALGLEAKDVQLFAFITMFLYFATGLVFMLVNLRGRASFWATARAEARRTGVRPIALLAPIVPIVLAFKFSTLTGIIEYYAGWELTPDQIALGESRYIQAGWKCPAGLCVHDRPSGIRSICFPKRYRQPAGDVVESERRTTGT